MFILHVYALSEPWDFFSFLFQVPGGGVLPYITYTYLYGYVPPNGVVILKLLI